MGAHLLGVTSLLPTQGFSHWREKQASSEMEKDAVCSAALHASSDALLPHWKACLSNLPLGALAWLESLEEGTALALPFQIIPGWWCCWHSASETGSSAMGLSCWAAQCFPNPDTANTHGLVSVSNGAAATSQRGSAKPLLMDLWLLILNPVMATPYITQLQHRGAEALMALPCCDVKVAQELSSSSAPTLSMGGEVGNMPLVGPLSLTAHDLHMQTGPRHLCFGSFFSSRKTASALWLHL